MIKKSKKIIASLLMTLSLVSVFPMTNAFAVTKEENEKYKNFLENECTQLNDWFIYKRNSDGKYFGRSTNTASDDVFAPNLMVGGSYYSTSDGSLAKNQWEYVWNGANGSDSHYYWHYYGSDCKQVTGFQTIDGKKYYFNKYGILYMGWRRAIDPTVDTSNMSPYEKTKHSVWYYYGENGAIPEGWVNYQGNWYYIYSDGLMAANTTTPDGYHVNSKGICVS